jgi:signal peptidase
VTGRRRGDPAAALLSVVATVGLAFGGGLLLWTLIPVLFGWSPTLVLTGSMTPSIRPGDVVVCSPVEGGQVRAGRVVRFRDPAQPGRYLLHRIARENSDGTLTTKGDANASADSTPVTRGAVTGLGRLRVPYVGLPSLWWREGQRVRAVVFVVTLFGLLGLAVYGWDRPIRSALPR